MLDLQGRIGSTVALELGQKLDSVPRRQVDGTAHSLYLVARGLMRTREPARLDAAIELLKRSRRLQPDYAPAIASLGAASHMKAFYQAPYAGREQALREGLALERQALAVEPNLAEAHAAIAMMLDFSGPEADRAMKAAVRFDPHSSENWFWLGLLYDAQGDYPRAFAAVGRAAAMDPLWVRTYKHAAEFAWALGYRRDAAAYLRRAEVDGRDPHLARSIGARLRGDWSAAADEAIRAYNHNSGENRTEAARELAWNLWWLGRTAEAARVSREIDGLAPLARGELPGDRKFLRAYPDLARDWRHSAYGRLVERLLLARGRGALLVAAYDRYVRRPEGLMNHPAGHQAFIEEAPTFAIALRRARRSSEADRILLLANAAVEVRFRKGPVPNWYLADAARLFAVRGESAKALNALEKAVSVGWVYPDFPVFGSLADEPAFAALRQSARFRRIADRLALHAQAERQQAGNLRWP